MGRHAPSARTPSKTLPVAGLAEVALHAFDRVETIARNIILRPSGVHKLIGRSPLAVGPFLAGSGYTCVASAPADRGRVSQEL
jgi:hypothetical protein